jgi:hypothetical protein
MDLQHLPLGKVKPGQHKKFVANHNACQSRHGLRRQFDPGFGSAFITLTRGIL